jgi:hypothetical protein
MEVRAYDPDSEVPIISTEDIDWTTNIPEVPQDVDIEILSYCHSQWAPRVGVLLKALKEKYLTQLPAKEI